jgi:hypothetical protein
MANEGGDTPVTRNRSITTDEKKDEQRRDSEAKIGHRLCYIYPSHVSFIKKEKDADLWLKHHAADRWGTRWHDTWKERAMLEMKLNEHVRRSKGGRGRSLEEKVDETFSQVRSIKQDVDRLTANLDRLLDKAAKRI